VTASPELGYTHTNELKRWHHWHPWPGDSSCRQLNQKKPLHCI